MTEAHAGNRDLQQVRPTEEQSTVELWWALV